jgi:hypothetical protein
MSRLYIAYGSNMNRAQMNHRCPAAKMLRPIMIDDARLVFRGVADMEFCAGAQVPVVLWEITEACEVALDKFEGVSANVYRKMEIPLDNGQQALIYIMTDDGVAPPTRDYFDRIARGYDDFGIDHEPLDAALKFSRENTRHTRGTRMRQAKAFSRGQGQQAQYIRSPSNGAAVTTQVMRSPDRGPWEKRDREAGLSQHPNAIKTRAALRDMGLCRHGWPHGVCEDCTGVAIGSTGTTATLNNYNWSDKAKANSKKSRKRNRNLNDYLNEKKYRGETH